jgi:superfamily I DNA/RNA helicase
MAKDPKTEAQEALDRIIASQSRKKLVVAGPGAGKTYLFRKLLDAAPGNRHQRLVLTFINTLKKDLANSLGDASDVFTLHGYCQYLLHRHETLRGGLSEGFRCYPTGPTHGLMSLIRKDWEWLQRSDAPHFVRLMRDLECLDEQFGFYKERANYYDAVDFDDSVFRTYRELASDRTKVPDYALVLIDEFQDFNKMEAAVIDLLAEKNSIVIAGDDDQALYSKLRGASWDYIRNHHLSGNYDVFELPFCMRCPEVIVGAVNDIIEKALARANLGGRIAKPYRYYEPIKGADSALYPHIGLIDTSVHRLNANYFGKYIEKCIRAISQTDKDAAADRNEPVALIIGSDPYRSQVRQHLVSVGLVTDDVKKEMSLREEALQILSQDPNSNLGWRILLASGPGARARDIVRHAAEKGVPLYTLIPDTERAAIIAEATAWVAVHGESDLAEESEEKTASVTVTSYQGSKGRSAQHVFIVGLHSGEMPRNAAAIDDFEICCFLVGLTRTKKKCDVLFARNANGRWKNPSEFFAWIRPERFQTVRINAGYFS